MQTKTPKKINPKTALITGALWSVGMRWSVKAIGLFNTVILARLLSPEDYGVVGMAFLVVGFISTFLDTGAGSALVRIGNPDNQQINSAWTLQGMQGCVLCVVLLIASPIAVIYFKEPRVGHVLNVVAICVAFMGFSNIGMSLAYLNLKFATEYKMQIFTKLSGAIATLIAAYYLKDYRALVTGIVAAYIAEWCLSYYLHPYRPKWDTSRLFEIWGISKWLMFGAIGGYFLRRTDQLIAGRVGNTHEYGLYSVGADIGLLPAGELGPAMLRPLFPILASIKEETERAKQFTLKTLSTLNTVTMPIGIGLAAVSTPAAAIVLGPKWIEATPFLMGFAIISTIQYMMGPLTTLLNVNGHTRVQSHIVWIEFFIFSACALALTPFYHLQGLIYARILSGICNAGIIAYIAHKQLGMAYNGIFHALIRPLSGSILMYFVISAFIEKIEGATMQLIISILVGMVVYVAWIFFSWILAKRPEGLEATIWQKIKN